MDIFKRSNFITCTNKDVTEDDIITAIQLAFGLEAISSVVPTEGGYFTTFVSVKDAEDCILHGIEVAGEVFEVLNVAVKVVVASFYGLPEFVADAVLAEKLKNMGCEIKGEILWVKNKKNIYTGVRRVKLALPEGVSSLPYRVKLKDMMGVESFYEVQHERQGRVCNGCLASDHIYKDCPKFVCFNCNDQGHTARNCPKRIGNEDLDVEMSEGEETVDKELAGDDKQDSKKISRSTKVKQGGRPNSKRHHSTDESDVISYPQRRRHNFNQIRRSAKEKPTDFVNSDKRNPPSASGLQQPDGVDQST